MNKMEQTSVILDLLETGNYYTACVEIMRMEVKINGLISANKSFQKCCRRRGKKIEYLKRCHEEKNKLLAKAQALLDEVELKKAEQAKKKSTKGQKA